MGYTTDFSGKFKINKKVDDATYTLLVGLSTTRRMKRSGLDEKVYGIDGEFYCEDTEDLGQQHEPSKGKIVDYNTPSRTQPSLWCHWAIQEDRQTIVWDGGEKFYEYRKWIVYLINKVLRPRKYVVNGKVEWIGEDSFNDQGVITVKNNIVTIKIIKGERL